MTAAELDPDRWGIDLATEADTFALGAQLGRAAEPDLVIGLVGDLGAGKTRLSQGIAEGLGIPRSYVTSPTFSLVQEYHGRLWLFHFDTYRLRNVAEFVELGTDEYLTSGGVCLIEWADRVQSVLPVDRLWITLTNTGLTSRRAEFAAYGTSSRSVLNRLRSQLLE